MRKKKIVKTLFIIFVLSNLVYSQERSSWFTERGNYKRTGFTDDYSSMELNDISLIWVYKTNDSISSSAVLEDINQDGHFEVLFGSDDDHVYALNKDGKLLWKFRTGGNVKSTPTVDDIEEDGNLEVLVGSDDGRLYVLDGEGNLRWSFQSGGFIRSSPAVYDLGGTTNKEIVFTSYDSKVYCLNDRGEKLWEYETAEPIVSSPALHDVDNDRYMNIIVGSTDNILYIISHPPHRVWTYQTQGDISSTPTVDGAGNVIVSSEDQSVYKLGRSSLGVAETRRVKVDGVWTKETISLTSLSHSKNYTTGGRIVSSPAVGPINYTGSNGIIVGSQDNRLYFIDNDFQLASFYSLSKSVDSSPVIADFNADNISEVIFGSNEKKVFVLNYPGVSRFSYRTHGPVKSGAAVADLTGDNTLEFVFTSLDGYVYAFGDYISNSVQEGNVFFDEALRYYNIGMFNDSRRFIEKARKVYQIVDYEAGVVKCDNLIKSMEADKILMGANELYLKEDYEKAQEELERASKIYFEIGDEAGIRKSEVLFKQIEASIYYLEAEYYYKLNLYSNASIYAEASKRFFSSAGDMEGYKKANQLANITQTYGKADAYLEDAMKARQEGKMDFAKLYLQFAEQSYQVVGDKGGIEKVKQFEVIMEADEIYKIAFNYYNKSNFENAQKYLEKAVDLYGNITGGYAEEARRLYNVTDIMLEAEEALQNADRYYGAGDFETASEYSKDALEKFNKSGNYDKYVDAKELYDVILETYTPAEERGGEVGGKGGIPLPLILFIGLALLAGAAYYLTRKKVQHWFMGGMRHIGRSIAEYRIIPEEKSISLIEPRRVEEKLVKRGVMPYRRRGPQFRRPIPYGFRAQGRPGMPPRRRPPRPKMPPGKRPPRRGPPRPNMPPGKRPPQQRRPPRPNMPPGKRPPRPKMPPGKRPPQQRGPPRRGPPRPNMPPRPHIPGMPPQRRPRKQAPPGPARRLPIKRRPRPPIPVEKKSLIQNIRGKIGEVFGKGKKEMLKGGNRGGGEFEPKVAGNRVGPGGSRQPPKGFPPRTSFPRPSMPPKKQPPKPGPPRKPPRLQKPGIPPGIKPGSPLEKVGSGHDSEKPSQTKQIKDKIKGIFDKKKKKRKVD